MDEVGVVKGISGPLAIVSVARKSACDQCKAGCKLTESGAEIEAINEIRAEVGQKVRVVSRPYTYLKGSLLVYGIPALALTIGAVIGKEVLSIYFEGTDPDIISAVAGFGAFFLSFILVKVWSNRVEKKIEYKPVIQEILE